MEKFDELLEELNGLNIEQDSIDWEESIPEEIWYKHFEDNMIRLKSEINISKHRWYEESTSVIYIYDRILGIGHISDIYSENSSVSDFGYQLEFFEMKQVQTISYTAK